MIWIGATNYISLQRLCDLVKGRLIDVSYIYIYIYIYWYQFMNFKLYYFNDFIIVIIIGTLA